MEKFCQPILMLLICLRLLNAIQDQETNKMIEYMVFALLMFLQAKSSLARCELNLIFVFALFAFVLPSLFGLYCIRYKRLSITGIANLDQYIKNGAI